MTTKPWIEQQAARDANGTPYVVDVTFVEESADEGDWLTAAPPPVRISAVAARIVSAPPGALYAVGEDVLGEDGFDFVSERKR